MDQARQTFVEKTFEGLKRAIAEVAGGVPEVEAVAAVVLWRLPDQQSIPSVLIQGAAGPLQNPDQFLRLHLATLKLEQFCIDRSALGVTALRALATNLATEARQAHARTEPQPQGPQTPPPGRDADADGNPHHDQA